MLHLLLRDAQSRALGIVAELRVPRAILLDDDGVGLAHGLDLEEAIHALEWDGFRLRHEKPDEEDGGDHHGGEEEEDAAAAGAHVVKHLGGEAGDDEVPEPELRC